MLGWLISVYRQQDGGGSPAEFHSPQAARVAVWQGGPAAIDWLKELATTGAAIDLGGNGYPRAFTAVAGAVLPRVFAGPPFSYERWAYEPGDTIGSKWEGKTTIDVDVANDCRDDEWLFVHIWDES